MAKARGIWHDSPENQDHFPLQLPSTGLMPWKCDALLALSVVKCNVVCNRADGNTGLFCARRTRWGNSARRNNAGKNDDSHFGVRGSTVAVPSAT